MLLEAVPNLALPPGSPVLDALLERLEEEASPGWALLDVHTDADHHRTVLTLAGAPSPMSRLLGTMVDAVEDEAEVTFDAGVHPLTGLVDVVPLIPLAGARTKDASRTAYHAARRLAVRDVPVHLYAGLARAPEHRWLAPLRMAHRTAREQGTTPPPADLGPDRPHPRMGCSCVGVRDLMVAYNVLLETTDMAIGAAIAGEIRAKDGGLTGVQSLAFPLPSHGDRVQVSCNLRAPFEVGPAQVHRAVAEKARDTGTRVLSGELVGLAPEACLPEDPAEMGLDERPSSLEAELTAHGLPAALGR